jgi:CHASE3 domain sensor protein
MSTTGSPPASKEWKPVLPGTVALVLMAMVGLSYRQFRQYGRANADAAQSRAIVDSIGRFLESVTEAETGQRGFLLTGEDRYLEPYNRAIQEIPAELSAASRLLAARSGQSTDVARLNTLAADKRAELRETIELRRTRGIAPPLNVDRGQQTMDQIRAICDQIRRAEIHSQSQDSTEGEAGAGTALLATIAGSVVLLFVFAFGLAPFASPEPQAWRRSWLLRYGAAAAALALQRGHTRVELNDLQNCALEVSRCDKIASECCDGEMRMGGSQETSQRLRTRLGLFNNGGAASGRLPLPDTGQPTSFRNRRPGTRLAKRDPISSSANG